MIESTRVKFDKTNEYVQNVLASANLSKEVLKSTEIESSLERLNNGIFKIAVVAPFTAGKSTFINSLLGFDLLSTSILVETAAITTVKYGETPRAEINYHDGSQIVIEGSENDLLEFKAEIKRYTAVNRSDDEFEVEASIGSVDVYWPIELCKNGVEIVDTPGLFGQYEAHSGITLGILNSVNAVIFIIDPSTVGEVNFMKVIREYVDNAKRTTLDNSDKHIFFAVNKIDQYPEAEVEKAYQELKKVLNGVVMAPKIFKVSSYFGLIIKMYEQGFMDINDIRRDETIKFVDDEGFPVAGRAIQETDIPTIRNISNIESVYYSLGIYFEEKNGYLISEVFQKLNRAIELELDAVIRTIEIEQKKHNEDSRVLKDKAESLSKVFKTEITKLRMAIEDLVEERVNSASNRRSIMFKLRRLYNSDVFDMVESLNSELSKEWRTSKRQINQNNSEEVLDKFFDLTDLKIENMKLQTNQTSFSIISKEIEKIVTACEELVHEMEQNFNQLFETELGISQTNNSFFDFDELLEELKQEIEKLFKGNAASEIKDQIEGNLGTLKGKNTTSRRAPGVINAIKSLFGKEKRITEFNRENFVTDIEKEVKLALEELEAELTATLRQMSTQLYSKLNSIVPQIIEEHLLELRVKNYTKWQQNQLNSLATEQQRSKEQYKMLLLKLNEEQKDLTNLLQENRTKYDEIKKLEEMELVG
ncbi:dynamin family protein [Cytobacillus sp. S13-E01]|uniref:dynamin family protein n=1 Tax=Cytobacillus sp. S13-E01 TaxID=3031326 RepID=UPI0023D855EF|nr:dynamin family protein [Cytobacillus sp. S13-E01]MDF0728888.1 dynamin family protein [Cytobacillus sp. S13-E01]